MRYSSEVFEEPNKKGIRMRKELQGLIEDIDELGPKLMAEFILGDESLDIPIGILGVIRTKLGKILKTPTNVEISLN
jgi:hypothetical protein